MAEFNIENSRIEQLNDAGDNIKITGNKGNVAVTRDNGQAVQSLGDENEIVFEKPKPSVLAKFYKFISTFFSSWFASACALIKSCFK